MLSYEQNNHLLLLNPVSELTFCKHVSSDGRLDRLLLFNFNITIHVSLAKASGRCVIFLELKLSECDFVFKALIIESFDIVNLNFPDVSMEMHRNLTEAAGAA